MSHASLDDLADLHAGEASPEVADHVAGCADCTARLGELAAALGPVAADLAALAAQPVPALPDDVAARVAAALAAERQAPPAAPSGTVVPLASPRQRRTASWLPALGGLAAAAVLVTGGLLLATGGSDRSSDDSTAAVAGRSSDLATSETGTDYAPDGAALKAALPGLLSGTALTKAVPEADQSTATPRNGAGTNSVPLNAQVPPPDALAALRDPDRLAACLAGLSDPGRQDLPLALDYARFQGKPALVVVLPAVKADKVDVFVVGAGCDAKDQQLLFFTRLDKP